MTAERLLRTFDQPRRLIWLAFAAIVTVGWSVLLAAHSNPIAPTNYFSSPMPITIYPTLSLICFLQKCSNNFHVLFLVQCPFRH